MIRNIVGALVHVGAGKAPARVDRRAARRPRPHAAARDVRRRRPLLHRRRLRRAVAAAGRRALPVVLPLACPPMTATARASRSAASPQRRRTASPPRRPAPTRSASCSGPGRRGRCPVGRAAAIAAALPPFVTVVGLFVDPDARARARDARRACRSICCSSTATSRRSSAARSAGRYVKAIAVGADAGEADLLECASRYRRRGGAAVRRAARRRPAGRHRQTFDWGALSSRLRERLPRPVVLSGGLDRRQRRRGDPRRAAVGGGRLERRRGHRRGRPAGEGHQGSVADRRIHRGSAQCRCTTCPTRAATSAPTAACSSPRR